MGNSQCVPQAPRRLRASFSRRPSLKGNREDGTRKLASLFGAEAGSDGDTAADKIFYYIPGTDVPGLESQPQGPEQPFLSVFKKGRRRVPVRNLGKVVHYAKVQLRFQHSQDISDCFLELFPAHLYFQAHGSQGLTFQGLLPLTELSICPLKELHELGFQITGPLPAPLLVLCPSEAELSCWLYHLEKQMALAGGLRRCHSVPPPQGIPGDELPWTLERHLTQLRRASGHEPLGSAICASRVKLQHLPSKEQWDRLLVLYPASLAIFSEEADGLSFKGELPLSAIHVNLEEEGKQIRSFLIEGRLINTIRVVCTSYEDYSHWLLCLRAVSHRDGVALLPSLKGSTGHQEPAQDQASPGGAKRRVELRRGGSSRSPRGKTRGKVLGPVAPWHLHLDLSQASRLGLGNGPEASEQCAEAPHSPLYADPYTPPATSHHKIAEVCSLDEFLSAMPSSPGPEPSRPFPSVPVSVPVSDPSSGFSSFPGLSSPHLLSKKGAPQTRASQRHRGSVRGLGPRPPDSPQLVSPTREGSPSPLLHPPDGESPLRDKTSSPSHQKWLQLRRPEAEKGLIQWI